MWPNPHWSYLLKKSVTEHFIFLYSACINQLISITYSIFSVSLEVCDTSLDLSKAFDTIWHKLYMYKLNNSKINGNLLLDLLELFLYSRRPKVVLNGKSSNWKFVKTVVPQGFASRCLFFCLLFHSYQWFTVRAKLFAHDTCWFLTVNCAKTSASVLNIN